MKLKFDFKATLKELEDIEEFIKGKTLEQACEELDGWHLDEKLFDFYSNSTCSTIIKGDNGLELDKSLILVYGIDVINDGECENPIELTYNQLVELANSNIYCNRCHNQVAKSKVENEYQCFECNKDLLKIETYKKLKEDKND